MPHAIHDRNSFCVLHRGHVGACRDLNGLDRNGLPPGLSADEYTTQLAEKFPPSPEQCEELARLFPWWRR